MTNESNANDFNARDYLNSTFIKKTDLRQSGPRRLTIKASNRGRAFPAGTDPRRNRSSSWCLGTMPG